MAVVYEVKTATVFLANTKHEIVMVDTDTKGNFESAVRAAFRDSKAISTIYSVIYRMFQMDLTKKGDSIALDGGIIFNVKSWTIDTPYDANPYVKWLLPYDDGSQFDRGCFYGVDDSTVPKTWSNYPYLVLVHSTSEDLYTWAHVQCTKDYYSKGESFDYQYVVVNKNSYVNSQIGVTIFPGDYTGKDPYADGGASDTGGGGGSFDGTTEIINEPDSPLVNISNTHFVSLYNPTESQINSLSNYMWNTLAIENWRKIVADPMDAIISLAVLPIDVPSSGTREIYVGAFSTGIACNVASAQYISFDCGTILIPQYSKSYLDYAPYTDISVYIPYVGLRSLPCDAIMGKTIGLKYRIDIFSGACVVYLTVNGSVLLQFTGNCAQPIPFTSQSWGTAVTNAISMVASGASMIAMPATAPLAIANMASTAVNGGFKADITKGGGSGGNTGFLGVQKPYVIIQRPVQCIPANQNTFTGYPSYITATFGDLKGYTELDKIILENINATESELNELESILKGGVYVNEL